MKPIICISIFLLAGLLSANFVFATESPTKPQSIVINEIAWMGSEVNSVESKNWWRYEWIELYNNTGQPISIDRWKIELYRDDLDWSLKLEGNIKPKNYFLITASDKIADYDLNYSNLTGKFVNKGQKILLKNAQGKIIDEINCSAGWFYGDNKTKQTMERIDANLSGNSAQNWQTSQSPGGTPKSTNSVITDVENTIKPQIEPLSSVAPMGAKEEETEKPKAGQERLLTQTNDEMDQGPSLNQTDKSGGGPSSAQYPLSSILIASITAIFSGAIILLLKNKTKSA